MSIFKPEAQNMPLKRKNSSDRGKNFSPDNGEIITNIKKFFD
jgi:hypothetical protein